MNIFLVEDEHWALKDLAEVFQRYEPEHNVHTFKNGNDAWLAFDEIRPQLVVTDITMPEMDGLELIKQMKELDPTVTCILLSVHDQFKYAQRGVKLGVFDYLLKPIDTDALYQTINRAMDKITELKKQRVEYENWNITKMLMDSTEGLTLPHGNERVCMALFVLENWAVNHSWVNSTITNEKMKSYFSSTDCAEGVHCLDIDNRRRLMLIPITKQFTLSRVTNTLKQLYRYLKEKEIIHMSYRVKNNNDHFNVVYSKLDKKVENHMRFGQSTFILPEDKANNIELSNIWVKVRVMEELLLKGDTIKVKDIVTEIVTTLKQKKITLKELTVFVSNIYYALTYKVQQKAGQKLTILTVEENFSRMKELSTFEELTNWLQELILDIGNDYKPAELIPKHLISSVMEWIHHNYYENLFLQDFANEHHTSLSYLSREFKTQTNYNFSEYLMRYRVQKAKEFIQGGIERTGEVGHLVGYADTKYFSSIFKRIEGLTPSEYKKKMKESK